MGGTTIFSSIFGESPITPIQKHMSKSQECVALLEAFLQKAVADDWEGATLVQQQIVALEHEADELKREVRKHLPTSLFLPVPRTDLLEVISMQDKIADRTKDIAGIMLGRRMQIPSVMNESIPAFANAAIKTSGQALLAIQELDELMETGFGGKEITIIEKLVRQLDELENEADRREVEVRAQLFAIEKELHPVDVMFLYKVIDWIGDLADLAQKVGSRLLLLLAR